MAKRKLTAALLALLLLGGGASVNAEVLSPILTNYKVVSVDSLWLISKKYNTTMDAIMKSNMLVTDEIMPNQTLTIPVNSTAIVKPVGITRYMPRVNNIYGDIYTW